MKTRYPDRKELIAIVFDETKRNPLTVMPPFGRNMILTRRKSNPSSTFFTRGNAATRRTGDNDERHIPHAPIARGD